MAATGTGASSEAASARSSSDSSRWRGGAGLRFWPAWRCAGRRFWPAPRRADRVAPPSWPAGLRPVDPPPGQQARAPGRRARRGGRRRGGGQADAQQAEALKKLPRCFGGRVMVGGVDDGGEHGPPGSELRTHATSRAARPRQRRQDSAVQVPTLSVAGCSAGCPVHRRADVVVVRRDGGATAVVTAWPEGLRCRPSVSPTRPVIPDARRQAGQIGSGASRDPSFVVTGRPRPDAPRAREHGLDGPVDRLIAGGEHRQEIRARRLGDRLRRSPHRRRPAAARRCAVRTRQGTSFEMTWYESGRRRRGAHPRAASRRSPARAAK